MIGNKLDLNGLLEFSKFIYSFREIERTIYRSDGDRRENDSEHSYQLAMICWYIISTQWLDLDISKVMKYALAHDLVEIYAGDTDTFGTLELKNNKEEREKIAFEKIKVEFAEFEEMIDIIHNYENKDNKESQFVYAVDKIISPINIYNAWWFQRKQKWITLEQLLENKSNRISISNEAKPIRDALSQLFIAKQKELFYQE